MKLVADNLSLKHTIEGGQFFQFLKRGNGYIGWSGDDVFYVEQSGATLNYEGVSEQRLKHILGLDVDYNSVINSISKDGHIRACIKAFPGLRIMGQDFYECLIAYICSANSNIPKITKNVHLLSQFFGRPVSFKGETIHRFPEPSKICIIEKVTEAKTGFRAKYICETNGIAGLEYIIRIKKLGYREAREELMKLPGVGPKVSDCVCLFSLGHYSAFPVDVWIRRVMHELYFPNKQVRDIELQEFARARFGQYCGYANQYLFHYRRNQ